MRIPSLALLSVLCAAALGAHEAHTLGVEGWHEVVTPDMRVISHMGNAETVEWAGRLNQFAYALKGRLKVDPRMLGPFTLILFKDTSDFWSSVPVLKSGDPMANVAGFSRAGGWGAIAATCERGSSEDTQRMIYEACVNWVMSADHRYRPRALGTGIDEVYGAYVVENGQEIFGQPVRNWTTQLQKSEANSLTNAETFLNIEELLSVRDLNEAALAHGTHMFSVESWGFAHFLMFSKEMSTMHAMDRLLDAFSHTRNAHDALAMAFGKDASSINTHFRNYIRGGDFFEIALPVEKAPEPGPLVVADRAEVAAALSHLESTADQLEVARAYAQQAIQLDPNSAAAHDALALVDFKAGRGIETEAESKEAIRRGSQDAWTWLEASIALAAGTSPAEDPVDLPAISSDQARVAVNVAEKAILMRRSLEAAYIRVARLMPKVVRVTEDDGKFLMLGRTLFPDDGWIEIGHAQWARRMNDNALALKILDDAIAHQDAFTPRQAALAHELRDAWSAQKS
ncbi:MAG TPA: hypothetical protein VFE25_03620 [Opitutaceae bacterium]|jgi:tetratricopeptide (TPR) repeat protein|nr:hypothetical protein [Opitutaceae bacterium]